MSPTMMGDPYAFVHGNDDEDRPETGVDTDVFPPQPPSGGGGGSGGGRLPGLPDHRSVASRTTFDDSSTVSLGSLGGRHRGGRGGSSVVRSPHLKGD